MGFDFWMMREPPPAPGYKPQEADEPRYFRVDIGGYPLLEASMRRAGLLDDSTPVPDEDDVWHFPEIDASRLAAIELHVNEGVPLKPPLSAEERAMLEEARRRAQALSATRSRRPGMVPTFKFATNDAWHVVPEECEIVADAVERLLADEAALATLASTHGIPRAEVEDFLAGWAGYNRAAVPAGGYRVD